MNYKVKIVEVNKSFSLAHHSSIDLGVFTVNASTYSFLYDAVKTDWACDINDTEIEFLVNNKKCKYVGFKELYTQLYGNSFATFEADLIRQIEEEVAKQIVKEYPGTDVNF